MNRERPEREELDEPFFEQHTAALALLVVGVLGIVVGVVRPDRTVELSLGLLIVFFVVRTMIVEARRAHEAARSLRRRGRDSHA